jgi:hypothetical protein
LSDKDRFDFEIVVTGTSEFLPHSNLRPSVELPPRELGEHQAWISARDELLEKPLELLKRMVLALIHNRPAIMKVTYPKGTSLFLTIQEEILTVTGGVLTRRECDVLLLALQRDGLVKGQFPYIEVEGYVCSV